jgi:hypothetical protein
MTKGLLLEGNSHGHNCKGGMLHLLPHSSPMSPVGDSIVYIIRDHYIDILELKDISRRRELLEV